MSQHVIENNPLSRNISSSAASDQKNGDTEVVQNGTKNFKKKSKKSNNQNCNAPGAMIAYSQYAQVMSLEGQNKV